MLQLTDNSLFSSIPEIHFNLIIKNKENIVDISDVDKKNDCISKRIRALSKYSYDIKLIDYGRGIGKTNNRRASQPRRGLNIKVVDIVKPKAVDVAPQINQESLMPLVPPPRAREIYPPVLTAIAGDTPNHQKLITSTKRDKDNDTTKNDYQFGISQLNKIHKSLVQEFQKETMEEFENLHKQIEQAKGRTIRNFQKLHNFMDSSTSSVENVFKDLK